MKKLISFIVFFSVLLITSSAVYAKGVSSQNLGMIISPPVFSNITANPGSTVSNVIKVYNTSPNPLSVLMQVDNYTAVGYKGAVKLESPSTSTAYSLASWTTVSPTNLTILPNSYKYVHFVINVPINAQPGSRFASIVAFASGSNSSGSSQIGTKIGSLILLTVSGNAKVSAIISSFKTNSTLIQSGNINFLQKIKDTGNVTLKPTGKIIITNMFGSRVASIPIQQKDIIPGAIRQTEEEYNVGGLFGYYTASLIVNYNSEGKGGNIFATTGFYVIPVGEIIIILIILILIYIFRGNIKRAYKGFFSKS